MLQRHAVEKFHSEEHLPVLLANVVDRANIGMIQCRGSLRFALETGERLWIAGKLFRQEPEGDEALKPGVLGLVHHAHATAAELTDDAVVRDSGVDHGLPML